VEAERRSSTAVDDLAACLAPGEVVDSDAPEVAAYALRTTQGALDRAEQARRLYLAVRDDVRYDPYRIGRSAVELRASLALRRGWGFCTPKAALLAAAARSLGIPARLGFADVRNHLTSDRLERLLGTDLMVFHGYTELHLGGRWVKATPAFNRSLCEKLGIAPLDFDGVSDSVFQPLDLTGRRHMEYVRDRGARLDVPVEEMWAAWRESYGSALEQVATDGRAGWRDFERDAHT
jgi:transglutaminase-like putative cysteine protease